MPPTRNRDLYGDVYEKKLSRGPRSARSQPSKARTRGAQQATDTVVEPHNTTQRLHTGRAVELLRNRFTLRATDDKDNRQEARDKTELPTDCNYHPVVPNSHPTHVVRIQNVNVQSSFYSFSNNSPLSSHSCPQQL